MIRQAPTQGLWWMVLGSLAAHAAVAAIIATGVALSPRFEAPPKNVLVTKLVRLGTPRPKEYLPRKEDPPPPPPPPPPPVVVPQSPAVAPPTPLPAAAAPKPAPNAGNKATPSARERLNALSRMNNALDRLKHEVDGQADGSVDGDSDVAVLGDKFGTMVSKCIKDHYIIEGSDQNRLADLQATVLVRVGADGSILSSKIETSSGVPAFDRATQRAVSACGHVDPPPPSLVNQLRRDGIEITFRL